MGLLIAGPGAFCSAGLMTLGAQERLLVYQVATTIGFFGETEMQIGQNAGAWVQMSGSQKPHLLLRCHRVGSTSVIARKPTQAHGDVLEFPAEPSQEALRQAMVPIMCMAASS